MKSARAALMLALVALGAQARTCSACGTPPPPSDPPPTVCVVNNSVVLQLGTLFETSSQSQCGCGIGLSGPATGIDFTQALVGVFNVSTGAFAPVFGLNRFSGSDAAWTGGTPTPVNGVMVMPGATWFGFSNLSVPPVTPPPLSPFETYAIQFVLSPSNTASPEGLNVQYGSGLALPNGLPDFNHIANPAHSAQYSLVTVVPRIGDPWVPEPSTVVSALFALAGLGWCSVVRRARRHRSSSTT